MVLLRALIAFITLPGIVAIILPPLIGMNDPWRLGVFTPGLLVMIAGLVLLLLCVRDFYVSGKGTLAPWQPPAHLVVVGLYRHMRNPMYIGVLVLVLGWAIYLMSPVVFCYSLVLAIAFHIRVITNEELWLASKFETEWHDYSSAVARWMPRFTPWRGDTKGKGVS